MYNTCMYNYRNCIASCSYGAVSGRLQESKHAPAQQCRAKKPDIRAGQHKINKHKRSFEIPISAGPDLFTSQQQCQWT